MPLSYLRDEMGDVAHDEHQRSKIIRMRIICILFVFNLLHMYIIWHLSYLNFFSFLPLFLSFYVLFILFVIDLNRQHPPISVKFLTSSWKSSTLDPTSLPCLSASPSDFVSTSK